MVDEFFRSDSHGSGFIIFIILRMSSKSDLMLLPGIGVLLATMFTCMWLVLVPSTALLDHYISFYIFFSDGLSRGFKSCDVVDVTWFSDMSDLDFSTWSESFEILFQCWYPTIVLCQSMFRIRLVGR